MRENMLTVLYKDEDGVYEYQNEHLPEQWNGIPQIGDCILDRGVIQGRDRKNPNNHTIREVVARYFDTCSNTIVLVIKDRVPRKEEVSLILSSE